MSSVQSSISGFASLQRAQRRPPLASADRSIDY
jgi:hypothetical protein